MVQTDRERLRKYTHREKDKKVQTEGDGQEDREVERQTEKIEVGRLVEREKGCSGKRKERQRLVFKYREI
jgi:hypothetical protein